MPFDLTDDREQFNSVMLFVPFQADRSGFPDQLCFYLLFLHIGTFGSLFLLFFLFVFLKFVLFF